MEKAIELAEGGELSLVPIRRGITDVKLNCLLYDILTDRGFKLDLSTGTYAKTTLRNCGTEGG